MKRKPIQVGDRVSFLFGWNYATARVTEDRGHLGVGGRRILRVSLPIGEDAEPLDFEIPEDAVARVWRTRRR